MTQTKDLFAQAQQLGVCTRFSGTENPEELMKLFLTPQGVEFCQKNNFPDMAAWRTFCGPKAEELGIYIDAGQIALHNVQQVALIGGTQARLTYDDPKKCHTLALMHGARAHVEASGYAVVFVTPGDCEVTTEAKDSAKIL